MKIFVFVLAAALACVSAVAIPADNDNGLRDFYYLNQFTWASDEGDCLNPFANNLTEITIARLPVTPSWNAMPYLVDLPTSYYRITPEGVGAVHLDYGCFCGSLEQPPPCPISHPAECVLNTTLVEDSQCVFADASTRLAFRLLSGDDHCMIDVPTPPANSTLVFMSTVFQHSCVPYANEGGASAIALVPLDTSVACSPGDIHYAYNATTNELEYENCTSHSILYSLPLDTCINATIGQTSSNYTLSIPCNSFPPYVAPIMPTPTMNPTALASSAVPVPSVSMMPASASVSTVPASASTVSASASATASTVPASASATASTVPASASATASTVPASASATASTVPASASASSSISASTAPSASSVASASVASSASMTSSTTASSAPSASVSPAPSASIAPAPTASASVSTAASASAVPVPSASATGPAPTIAPVPQKKKVSDGAIAGIVIGCVLAFALVVFGIMKLRSRHSAAKFQELQRPLLE